MQFSYIKTTPPRFLLHFSNHQILYLKMKKSILFALLLQFIFIQFSFAQNEINLLEQEYLSRIPNSPEASSMIEYGNNSISAYTGKPNISVPIYTIKGREMTFPISMDYNAGGIKVEQEASWVGLGWSLNANGVITRQINGLVDDVLGTAYYKKHYQDDVKELMNTCFLGVNPETSYDVGYVNDCKFNFERKIERGEIDTRPDYFNFNVNGFSGEFFIDYENLKGVCINNPAVKIIPEFLNTSNSTNDNLILEAFKIIDDNGTQYFFDKPESTTVRSESANGTRDIYSYYSSWYITKIISKTKQDEITFQYSGIQTWDEKERNFEATSLTSYLDLNIVGNPQAFPHHFFSRENHLIYQIETFFLNSISLNQEEIVLIETNTQAREDIPGGIPAISKLIVDYGNNPILEVEFSTSYFQNTDSNNTDPSHFLKRLKLDAIEFLNDDDFKYTFEYIGDGEIPKKNSKSQDYWGFHNGKQNESLIPKSTFDNVPYGNYGGNRSVSQDIDISGIGTLDKIIYPTKGSSKFFYEAHKAPQETEVLGRELILLQDFLGGWSQDPYNVSGCYPPPNNWPLGEPFNFTVLQGGTVKFDVIREINPNGGSEPSRGTLEFLAIYPFDLVGVSSPLNDFCEIYGNSNVPLLETNPNGEYIVDLAPGNYSGIYLSNDSRFIKKVVFYEDKINTPLVGGLRVKNITDYDFNGVYEKSKQYFYNDFTDFNFNSFQGIGNNYESSSIVQVEPVFNEYYYWHYAGVIGCNGTMVNGGNTELLYFDRRYAHNRSISRPYNITYSTVSILEENENSFIAGGVVMDFFNYKIPENNYSSYIYGNPILNGTLKNEKIYNSDKLLISSSENFYSLESVSNFSMDILLKSSRDYQCGAFIVQQENSVGALVERLIINEVTLSSICGGQVLRLSGPPSPSTNPDNPNHVESFTQFYSGSNMPVYDLLFQAGDYDWKKKDSLIQKKYFYNASGILDGVITNNTSYTYDNSLNYNVISKTFSSGNENLRTEFLYPQDLLNEPYMQDLVDANRISEPIEVSTLTADADGTNEGLLSTQKTEYNTFGSLILPKRIQTSKDDNTLETRVIYHDYDDYGNPVDVSQADGTRTSYIWGYNGQYPVAKIDNSTFSAIPSIHRNAVINASNANPYNETNLKNALAALRNALPDAMVSTYIYKPLVGVTSMTDPRGYTMTYEYDEFNRLEHVKDADGNILSKNEYNYKN